MIPTMLRKWFIFHFIVDIIFAVPLLLFPVEFLQFLQWHTIDPLASRIVGAALMGIGIESWIGRNAGVETFKNMLNLKIIWSAFVIIGTALSIYQAQYVTTITEWFLLITFIAFHFIWIYWRYKISRTR